MKIEVNDDVFDELVLEHLKSLYEMSKQELKRKKQHTEDKEAWRKIAEHSKGLIEVNWPYIKL